ncbi:hypothetical protein LSTR_LSTR001225 [Laodelphax striatellus]|uniref:Uncharacterized protein n=1 Tax=Laodelphax striatellus TaxID=195883 RepID=A0A482XBI2_LAOST|nr:hypothetical protein LSTR_LSTR001225 [Laodelphax striatellus]
MSAVDFLADKNPCGTNLLKLVTRGNGNAIIADLLRWDKKQDQIKYADIVSDFSYYEKLDEFDEKIENEMTLHDLDDEFRESLVDILERFCNAFQSIQKYASDLNGYIEDLEEEVYIQQTLECVVLCEEEKELLNKVLRNNAKSFIRNACIYKRSGNCHCFVIYPIAGNQNPVDRRVRFDQLATAAHCLNLEIASWKI